MLFLKPKGFWISYCIFRKMHAGYHILTWRLSMDWNGHNLPKCALLRFAKPRHGEIQTFWGIVTFSRLHSTNSNMTSFDSSMPSSAQWSSQIPDWPFKRWAILLTNTCKICNRNRCGTVYNSCTPLITRFQCDTEGLCGYEEYGKLLK